MPESIKKRATIGAIWAAVDRFGIVLLQFVINIVLARLLTPEDFGCIGMITIFVAVSQTLIDGGFGSALIQKKDATQQDFSTIFYWNILFSVFLYVILFSASPSIAAFFRMPQLTDILRVLGVVLLTNAFGLVQKVKLRKQLDFRKIAISNIGSNTIAAVIAIVMAHNGFGVWSLVWMQLFTSVIFGIFLWILAKWYPSLIFSLDSLKRLFGYGGYLLITNVLQDFCTHLQGVVIGRKFSAVEMGLYSQAKKMDEVACLTFPNIIVQVVFPLYSELQNDLNRLRELLRQNTRVISFIIFPLMTLLIVIADQIIVFLFGEKWVDAVPYFQVLCIGGFFACLQNMNYYAIAAIGKSGTLFRWSFYKWGFLLTLLLVSTKFGMNGVLVAMVVSNINIYFINAYLVHRYIGYTIVRQLRDVAPMLGCSILAGTLVAFTHIYTHLHFIPLTFLFTTIYMFVTWRCKLPAIKDVRSIVLTILNQK